MGVCSKAWSMDELATLSKYAMKQGNKDHNLQDKLMGLASI